MNYLEDVLKSVETVKNLDTLKNKTIYITGSAGQIGKTLVELFVYLNEHSDLNTKLILNTRNVDRINTTFSDIKDKAYVSFHIGDITEKITLEDNIDYIISAASNTHPLAYANDPVGTALTNVYGAKNIFDLAIEKSARVINLSTVEIYGDATSKTPFTEKDMGYLDCNTSRACYNESKRLSETLLQSYIAQYSLNAVTVRLPRLFGPETKKDDTKALSQFLNNAINGEDIVLKSTGEQFFSYLYTPDAISGILTILINGKTGEVYNLSSQTCDIHLKDLAALIAKECNVKVVFDLPDEKEKQGFSKAQYAILDSTKAQTELEWHAAFDLESGISHTISIMKI